MKVRAGVLIGGLFSLALALAPAAASAQAYPSKPIRVVVPYQPGGLDVVVRVTVPGLQSELGVPAVIDNRPGAGGTIGANIVAKAAPDGYTVLVSDPGSTVHAIGLMKQLPYDPAKEFVTVGTLLKTSFLITAGSAAKYSTMREMVEYVKANPGAVPIGDSGASSTHHLALELLKQRSGLDFRIIHYKGAAAALQDLLGGQIPSMISGANSVIELVKSGKIKLIGVTGKTRHASFPDAPTFAEVFPGYEATIWTGVWMPTGTPRDIIMKFNAALVKTVNSPEVVKRFLELGLEAYSPSQEEATRLWQSDLAIWPDLIRKLGLGEN